MAREIQLKARQVGYSSVVGGGVTLDDAETGHANFILSLIGTTKGVTKKETEEVSARLTWLINEYGLYVSERGA
jgi:hypothetical protein